jgi:hypothetical protein
MLVGEIDPVIDYVAIAKETLALRFAQPETIGLQESDSTEESWMEVRSNANALLNREGIRLFNLDGVVTVCVWSDRDGPEIRNALQVLGMNDQPIYYLDGDNVPETHKERDVEGEPVPMCVLRAMESAPEQPWIVRDQMLAEIGWSPEGITWETWRATSPISSDKESCPTAPGNGSTPEGKTEFSRDAVNAFNAIVGTQLDLYADLDATDSPAVGAMAEAAQSD